MEEGDPATGLPAHPLESSKSPRVSLISPECELIPLGLGRVWKAHTCGRVSYPVGVSVVGVSHDFQVKSFLRRWPGRSNLWLEFCSSNPGTCSDREQRTLATPGPLLFNAAGGTRNQHWGVVRLEVIGLKGQQLSLPVCAVMVTYCDLQYLIVVRSGYSHVIPTSRACKMTVNFALTLGHAVSRTSATITFQHAMRLQIAEERMATSLTLQLGELKFGCYPSISHQMWH